MKPALRPRFLESLQTTPRQTAVSMRSRRRGAAIALLLIPAMLSSLPSLPSAYADRPYTGADSDQDGRPDAPLPGTRDGCPSVFNPDAGSRDGDLVEDACDDLVDLHIPGTGGDAAVLVHLRDQFGDVILLDTGYELDAFARAYQTNSGQAYGHSGVTGNDGRLSGYLNGSIGGDVRSAFGTFSITDPPGAPGDCSSSPPVQFDTAVDPPAAPKGDHDLGLGYFTYTMTFECSDNDGDGLSIAGEFRWGTGPARWDSDEDGLQDGPEVHTFHTDPLNPDTDLGGVPDGEEVMRGFDPLESDDDFVADLALTKTDPPGRQPTGRNMTYTLTVTNSGRDHSTGVTVTDPLPSSMTFVSATPSQGSCAESGGTVACDLGTMANAAIVTVDIVVQPTVAGVITNTASVTASTTDPSVANNSDSESTSVCRITSRRSSIPCG